MKKFLEKDIKRFEKKFNKTDNCWIWKKYKDRQGYGIFSLNEKFNG